LNGTLEYGRPEKKLKFDVAELKLDRWPFAWPPDQPPPPLSTSAPEEPLPEPWKLEAWPEWVGKIDRLTLQGEPLGELRWKLVPTGSSTRIEFARWTSPRFELVARQGESFWPSPDQPARTVLDAEWTLHDWGRATPYFRSFEAFEGKEGQFRLQAEWPGAFNQFALKNSTGQFSGTLQSGKLTGVRNFIQTLFNTLSLNFADARRGTMRFSKLHTELALSPGKIQVREARALFGTVFAKLEGSITGPERKLALEAMVTPSVEDLAEDATSFVPEAGKSGSRAGPQKKDPRNILTHRYKIGGVWDSPEISFSGL
jgi:uncharacterized protein YhdP